MTSYVALGNSKLEIQYSCAASTLADIRVGVTTHASLRLPEVEIVLGVFLRFGDFSDAAFRGSDNSSFNFERFTGIISWIALVRTVLSFLEGVTQAAG